LKPIELEEEEEELELELELFDGRDRLEETGVSISPPFIGVSSVLGQCFFVSSGEGGVAGAATFEYASSDWILPLESLPSSSLET